MHKELRRNRKGKVGCNLQDTPILWQLIKDTAIFFLLKAITKHDNLLEETSSTGMIFFKITPTQKNPLQIIVSSKLGEDRTAMR